jgi:hypothetical protein
VISASSIGSTESISPDADAARDLAALNAGTQLLDEIHAGY